MRLAVIGAGGAGGYFGGWLAHAGAEAAPLARGAHLTAIKQRGLRIRSVEDDFTVHIAATGNPADIGPRERLSCVKSYDTHQAATLPGPIPKPGTAVIPCKTASTTRRSPAAALPEAERAVPHQPACSTRTGENPTTCWREVCLAAVLSTLTPSRQIPTVRQSGPEH